ncbi:MAG: hypothetical protein EOQ41_03055 [Mesorhizobium sp.]|uniref:hypothetical protein n=1 Tax=Mesorhizobium sp. TaxID=1871066 RepID=UPI000FE4DE94|nr:hypothetical protein [Mesorhizobium sp.]RWB35804.1 MAG: hypothetical protein EOQ41_03055 [Mesorhizobium sp.]
MQDDSEDPISLSFIDCISCGLAAAVFLFLVFAAIPRSVALAQQQSTGASGGINGAAALPALFDGTGSDVPVDIVIVLNGPVAEGEGTWQPLGNDDMKSSYRPADGMVTAFLGSFRSSDDDYPTFVLTNTKARLAVSGTITIRAGSDSASLDFACPAAPAGTSVSILSFENGPWSECKQ